jgi:sodium-coupled neutral amino acid transporter 11
MNDCNKLLFVQYLLGCIHGLKVQVSAVCGSKIGVGCCGIAGVRGLLNAIMSSDNDTHNTDTTAGGGDSSNDAVVNTVPRTSRSTVFQASFNFVNSIVGSGIIGMPYAIKQSGFFMGVFLICLVAWLLNKSSVMLIDCGLRNNKLDYELLSEHVLGRKGYFISLISMMLFAFGGQISYFILIGDTMPIIAEIFCPGTFLADRTAILSILAVFIILPLCLMRDLSSLSFTSFMSIVADIVLIVIVICVAPLAAKQQHISHSPLQVANTTLFAGIGTLSFAFVCQHNCFMVFQSLEAPTSANWRKVSAYSLSVSFVLCLMLALGGYLSFQDFTQADILNSFPQSGNV